MLPTLNLTKETIGHIMYQRFQSMFPKLFGLRNGREYLVEYVEDHDYKATPKVAHVQVSEVEGNCELVALQLVAATGRNPTKVTEVRK